MLILALCVGLYALLGFLTVPWLLRDRLPELVGDYSDGTASVREIRFNPFAFSLTMQGFELREPLGPLAWSSAGR